MARTWFRLCAIASLVCTSVAATVGTSFAMDVGNKMKSTVTGLGLQELSLPPEVITEALFSQVDVIQDKLEQCEEKVRNILKGDLREESVAVNSNHDEESNEEALETFGNNSKNYSDNEDDHEDDNAVDDKNEYNETVGELYKDGDNKNKNNDRSDIVGSMTVEVRSTFAAVQDETNRVNINAKRIRKRRDAVFLSLVSAEPDHFNVNSKESPTKQEDKQQLERIRSLEKLPAGDPERFVPLIGQLVERLNHLKHSLDVCHAMLTFGMEGH